MANSEHYLQRAARLREALKTLDDPLAKIAILALVEALEELAAETGRGRDYAA
jgi:hypothetical protein